MKGDLLQAQPAMGNKYLPLGIAAVVILQLIFTYTPLFQAMFGNVQAAFGGGALARFPVALVMVSLRFDRIEEFIEGAHYPDRGT
jgi:hypothetical protein